MATTVHIALGSNLGDRRATLDGAVARLREEGLAVEAVSRWIETEPVDAPGPQGLYLNGVLRGRFDGDARELLRLLQRIEEEAGRQRLEPNGARTLDLDLLLFGTERSDRPECTLPHPRMEERTFVLEPLCEIDPDLVLPRSGRRVRDRLRDLTRERPAGIGT